MTAELIAEQLAELRPSNQERLDRLAVDGLMIHPLEMLKDRLDHITNAFIGALAQLTGMNPEELDNQIELRWEQKLADRILEIEAERNRAKLTAGVGNEHLTIADFIQ